MAFLSFASEYLQLDASTDATDAITGCTAFPNETERGSAAAVRAS